MSREIIYLDNSTTAADMVQRRNVVRTVSKHPNLRFQYRIHPLKPGRVRRSNLAPQLSVIEPAPVQHPKIDEVV